MRIAQVVGKVTLSRAHPSLMGLPLRLVMPLSLPDAVARRAGADADMIAAVDPHGAGEGSLILMAEGPEAAQAFHPNRKPIDAYVAAILDSLSIDTTLLSDPS